MKYFLVLFLLCPLVALASGDKITQSNDMNNQTAGDLVTGGNSSKALGLGRSSFDVDINQCMGSTSWDTVIGGKQKLVLNWVCLAEFYLKAGQPRLAAQALCNTEVISEYASEKECEDAHQFLALVKPAPPPPLAEDDDDEDWHEEQMQMQEDYDVRIAALEGQLAQRATSTHTVIKENEWMTDEKRAKLEAVLAK